ncbi:MAG: hypothetical protein ACSHX3_09900 [Litorimonas sp.]
MRSVAFVLFLSTLGACNASPDVGATGDSQVSVPQGVAETDTAVPERAKTTREALNQRDFVRLAKLMQTEPDTYRMFRQKYSFMGRDSTEIDPNVSRPPKLCTDDTRATLQNGAVDAVLKAAQSHRIIIINEDHSSPQNRAFIRRLLPSLRRMGFTHYAAETFYPADDDSDFDHDKWQQAVMDRGYLPPENGYYTEDPVFAQTVVDALSLGLKPVSYESVVHAPEGATPEERVALRESEQARQLWERVLSDPNAKVLIHVGHSHARETPDSFGHVWMAQLLNETYGLDPFTVSQTHCTDRQGDGWRYAVPDADSGFDLHVYPRPEILVNGRQRWLAGSDRVQVSSTRFIPNDVRDLWVVIEATDPDAPDLLIDRALVRPNETVDLILPRRPVRVTTYGERRTVLAQADVMPN